VAVAPQDEIEELKQEFAQRLTAADGQKERLQEEVFALRAKLKANHKVSNPSRAIVACTEGDMHTAQAWVRCLSFKGRSLSIRAKP
jgi:hypothetical protein